MALEKICGYDIVGMAYPCGGENNDDRVAAVIREKTKVQYARTIKANHSFEVQDNLYRFDPTTRHEDWDTMFELADKFLALPEMPDRPQIFYVWGHSYEFDADPSYWDRIEEFCKTISGKDDIFYGTNTEILLK